MWLSHVCMHLANVTCERPGMGNAEEKQNLLGKKASMCVFGDSSEEPVGGSEGWVADKSLVKMAGQRNA